jgi:hypothetical protein
MSLDSDSAPHDFSARVFKFVSHAETVYARGIRNWVRFKMKKGPFTHPDSQERAWLQEEQQQDQKNDRRWNLRHGPIGGGATVLPGQRGEGVCSD